MATRRQFIKYSGLAGAGLWAQSKLGWVRNALAADPGPGPQRSGHAAQVHEPGAQRPRSRLHL